MSSTSSTLVPRAGAPSSRALLALRAIHHCAAHPDLGASEDDIKAVLHDAGDDPMQHNPKYVTVVVVHC